MKIFLFNFSERQMIQVRSSAMKAGPCLDQSSTTEQLRGGGREGMRKKREEEDERGGGENRGRRKWRRRTWLHCPVSALTPSFNPRNNCYFHFCSTDREGKR